MGAIRKHGISPALQKISIRSAEDPRGSQGSEGTGWAPSEGMIDFPVRGRRAPGEIIDFSFYLHRGRSAEDPRKTPAEVRGRRAPGGHPVKESSISQSGAGGHPVRLSISHRFSLAEGTGWPPGGGLPGGHRVAGHRVATGWPPIQKNQFRLHRGRSAEDARKIRGRPPRKSYLSD